MNNKIIHADTGSDEPKALCDTPSEVGITYVWHESFLAYERKEGETKCEQCLYMLVYSPDDRLIDKAGRELQLMLETSPYLPSECLRRVFLPIIEQVRADVKSACPEIPPTPEGDFRAESNTSTLDISMMDDGGAEVDAYSKDEQVRMFISPDDLTRLRVWLKPEKEKEADLIAGERKADVIRSSTNI